MEASKTLFERSASVATLLALVVALVMMIPQAAYGQATTVPCSAAMLSSFTPCLNFLANSTSNGTSPTTDCCSSLKGILSNGTDCFCQIGTGAVRVPFRIPINRTLVMSLPKACKMGGVPLKCQSAATPIPAPGPTAFSPVQSPAAAPAFGGTTTPPAAGSPAAQGPVSDTTPSSTGTSLPPTSTSTGGSSTLNPTSSGASRSFTTASLLLPVSLAAMIFKYYC